MAEELTKPLLDVALQTKWTGYEHQPGQGISFWYGGRRLADLRHRDRDRSPESDPRAVPCPDTGSGVYQFTCQAGQPLPFFELIKQQTGWFAFSFKLEEFDNGVNYYNQLEHGIDGVMVACCNTFRACDPARLTSDDWVKLLSDPINGLGFADLVEFVNRNAAEYPMHANVIFAGDSEDSLANITTMQSAVCANPDNLCTVRAVSRLFTEAAAAGSGGWNGYIFIDCTDDPTTTGVTAAESDDGRSINFVHYDPITFHGSREITLDTRTVRFWRSWPSMPKSPAN